MDEPTSVRTPGAVIVVLVLISRDPGTIRLNAPATPGMSYHPAA